MENTRRPKKPLTDQQRKNKSAYDTAYNMENVTRKFIPFNKNNLEDAMMLDWLNKKGKGNVAKYVKGLIWDDMKRSGK